MTVKCMTREGTDYARSVFTGAYFEDLWEPIGS